MAPGFETKQGQQLLPELLRSIALRKETGYISLYHDKITRTIAFESGEPINAFSNLPSEQLDSRLIRDGAVAAGLVNAVKKSNPDPFMLGKALVDKGVVSFEVMARIAGELATQIALSLFQWNDAEHQFDDSEPPTCPRVIQTSTADLIVEGTRQAAEKSDFVNLVAPSGLKVARSEIPSDHIGASAKLSSTEGYVLALTNSPARLTEIAELAGLPDELVRPAVCVLLALGLLERVEESEEPIAPSPDHAVVEGPAEARSLLEGIRRKLHAFQTASHYEVLGVSERSSAAVINDAYEQLERMFESQLAEYGDRQEFRLPLEELRTRVREAHATLGNSTRRLQYDRARVTSPSSSSAVPAMHQGASNGNGSGLNTANQRSTGPRKPAPLPLPIPISAERKTASLPLPTPVPRKSTPLPLPTSARKPAPLPFTMPTPEPPLPAELLKRKNPEPIIERGQASEPRNNAERIPARKPIPIPEIKMPVTPKNAPDIRIERGQWDGSGLVPRPPRPSGPLTRPPAVLSPEEASRIEAGANKQEQAFHFYQQGKLRFERHELDAAVHLFRAAVNLDPSKAGYHFHLAVALSIRANARYEHLHHEGCHVTCKLGGALVSNPKVRYEAEQHFIRAAEIDPTDDEIPLKLGVLYKEAGLLKKAGIYLQQALTLNSKNETARRELESLNETAQENNGSIDTGLLRRGSGQGG